MKQINLLEEIKKYYESYKQGHSSDKLDETFAHLCEIATPQELEFFLNDSYEDLPAKTLTYAMIEVLKNKNKDTKTILLRQINENKFKNSNEINWEMVFNSLDKDNFKNINQEIKVSDAVRLVEQKWNKKEVFKEESSDLYGVELKAFDHYTYAMIMDKRYGGHYYQHFNNNPEKLNYILNKDIPYSQVKNMFFEAVRQEDTRSIGRLLHTKFAFDIAQDKEVHNFFVLEVPQSEALKDLKHEVLVLVLQLEDRYKEMLRSVKDAQFLKHPKI